MLNINDMPINLNQAGEWKFEALCQTESDSALIEGSGNTIQEAVEQSFEESPVVYEAWNFDNWSLRSLEFNGKLISEEVEKDMLESWDILNKFVSFKDNSAMKSCISKMQLAKKNRDHYNSLENNLIELLVVRSEAGPE